MTGAAESSFQRFCLPRGSANETSLMFLEAAARILDDGGAPGQSLSPDNLTMCHTSWQRLVEAGFPEALVPEADEGAGLSVKEAFPLAALAAAYAAPVPLADIMLANGLLGILGLYRTGMTPVFALDAAGTLPRLHNGTLSGVLPRTPWGRHVSHYALLAEDSGLPVIVLVARHASGVTVQYGANLAGEPRDMVVLDGVTPATKARLRFPATVLHQTLAVLRSAQIAGSIGRLVTLATEYANLRVQFGRPIAKFQAIQHMGALLAAEAVAAQAAADGGMDALTHAFATNRFDDQLLIATASAKIRCGEAAGLASSLTHQIFGAIGFTYEHVLHAYTKRLWAWRDEGGNEAYWSEQLGQQLAALGPDGLWPALTGASLHEIPPSTYAQASNG